MRFRLYPTPAQTLVLERHCADARYIWNLALEQWNCWQSGSNRRSPGLYEQCQQLTELRAAESWVAEGSAMVQQQALQDFDRAKRAFYAGTRCRPTWRRKGEHEGFRVVGGRGHGLGKIWDISQINRRWAEVRIQKVGWVRFRLSRPVPADAKSYRVTFKAGQWHIAFACIPAEIPGPGDGSLIGIDRGVAIPFACSDGTCYDLPTENPVKLRRLQRHLARQKKGSGRRQRTKARIAKVRGQEARRRKDAIEKATTDLARRADFFRVENLRIEAMTRSARGTVVNPGKRVAQKAGLNGAIGRSGWGLFAKRLEDKAPYRVEKVNPAFTSQRCAACGHVAAESRKSQARFRCVSCGYTANADTNAAKNIAAGHVATARGRAGQQDSRLNREPQPPGWNLGESQEDVKDVSGKPPGSWLLVSRNSTGSLTRTT
jgi:putative transposase